jgi:ABC-type transport system involved in Fe-S cluster assembly fused permease/ATPase subunit
MSQLSFDHILNLSYAWHTKRKTGEVLRVLDRGAAINHTLEVRTFCSQSPVAYILTPFQIILFNILPTFIDITAALVIFCVIFKWTLSLLIFTVMFAYGADCYFEVRVKAWLMLFIVAASVILTTWRSRLRRQMNERDIVSFLVSWESGD